MRAFRLAVASALLLCGCGRANDPATLSAAATPPPKPDVIVTLDGKTRDCLVALSREAQGSAVACDDVATFLRDELRVPRGAVYALHASADIDSAQVAKMNAGLQGAGYRSLGTLGRP
jgi:ABC-type Fe3+-hydroxamate transport system substrate-binding protein